MLEFTCSPCGRCVQADDAFAGKQVLCPGCNTAMTAPQRAGDSPTAAIAIPAHASLAKIAMPSNSGGGSFREGEPPQPHDALPSVRKEVPGILASYVAYLIVLAIIGVFSAVLIPVILRVRESANRAQSICHLKQIGLAVNNFHDTQKSFPFNGTVDAVAGDRETGSWAFQILPYIEQNPLFITKPLNTTISIPVYMCPGRGRPSVSTTGPWTDYFINTWINDPVAGAVNAVDKKRKYGDITDGVSNTIFVGHGSIDPTLYSSTVAIAQSTDIFKGGNSATARCLSRIQKDIFNDTRLTWGGPFSQGALMCMADGAVRMFPYTSNNIIIYLTPTGNDHQPVPP